MKCRTSVCNCLSFFLDLSGHFVHTCLDTFINRYESWVYVAMVKNTFIELMVKRIQRDEDFVFYDVNVKEFCWDYFIIYSGVGSCV